MPDPANPFRESGQPQEPISGDEVLNSERTTYQQINRIGREGSFRIPLKTVLNRFDPTGNAVTETVDHQNFDHDGRLVEGRVIGHSHRGFLIGENDPHEYCRSWFHPGDDRLVKDGSDGRVLPDGTARCDSCLRVQGNITFALVVCGTALVVSLVIGIYKGLGWF